MCFAPSIGKAKEYRKKNVQGYVNGNGTYFGFTIRFQAQEAPDLASLARVQDSCSDKIRGIRVDVVEDPK